MMIDPSNPSETEWTEKNTMLSSIQEFDLNDNLVKCISYNQQTEIEEFYEYRYDSDNRLIEEVCFFDEDEIAEQKFIEYNEAGNIKLEKILYADSSESIIFYFYNQDQKLIEKKVVNQEEETEEVEKFEYQGKQLIREIFYDTAGKILQEKSYEYNNQDKVSVFNFHGNEEEEAYRFEYFYNDNNDRIKSLKYNAAEQLVEKILYDYDEMGNLVKIYEENPFSKKATRIHYDESKNQVKHEEFNGDEQLILEINRTYDESNNLTDSLVYIYDPIENLHQMYAYKYEHVTAG